MRVYKEIGKDKELTSCTFILWQSGIDCLKPVPVGGTSDSDPAKYISLQETCKKIKRNVTI